MGPGMEHVRTLLEDAFSRYGYVTSRQLQRALGITRQSVWPYLRSLVDSGEVIVEGAGRALRYLPAPERDRGWCPYEATDRERFWADVQRAHPDFLYAFVRDGPGTSLRRHAIALLGPELTRRESVRHVVLDLLGVLDVGGGFARACVVELPYRHSFTLHAIHATRAIQESLRLATCRAELRPVSDDRE